MNAAEAIEGRVWLTGDAGAIAGGEDFVEAFHHKCGMGTFRRSEIRLEAEMKIDRAGDEPDAFALGHLRRLRDFGEAEDAGVEFPSAVFTRDGDGDLHVVDVKDWHGRLTPPFSSDGAEFCGSYCADADEQRVLRIAVVNSSKTLQTC